VIRSMGRYRTDASGRSSLDYLRAAGIELVDVQLPSLELPNVIEDEYPSAKQEFLRTVSSTTITASTDTSTTKTVPNGTDAWLRKPQGRGRAYQRKLDARESDRNRIETLLRKQKLGALIYPTINATPARIGDLQPSGNCALSSNTGLPALALPGGLGSDGLPTIGVDVLSVQYSEPYLLNLARRYGEQRTTLPIAGGTL
jgi:Asp-tRNA(Asn)/Glu-tRNA(Gln) amidotransferase A subunit family amidase